MDKQQFLGNWINSGNLKEPLACRRISMTQRGDHYLNYLAAGILISPNTASRPHIL